jgi:hypothetical protein
MWWESTCLPCVGPWGQPQHAHAHARTRTHTLTHAHTHTHTHAHTHTRTRTRAHTHAHTRSLAPVADSPAAQRWLHTGWGTFVTVSATAPTLVGGPGRGLPGGSGREECTPPLAPYGLPPGPSASHCPAGASAGLLEPARRGVKFMWPGLDPAVTGPHTRTQTHTGHPPPTLQHAHTRAHITQLKCLGIHSYLTLTPSNTRSSPTRDLQLRPSPATTPVLTLKHTHGSRSRKSPPHMQTWVYPLAHQTLSNCVSYSHLHTHISIPTCTASSQMTPTRNPDLHTRPTLVAGCYQLGKGPAYSS